MVYDFFLLSCKNARINKAERSTIIEKKIGSFLALMTLEKKIGQMSQVRHFDDISEGDIKSKLIGVVIHTQVPIPGETVHEWQQKFYKTSKRISLNKIRNSITFYF